MTRLTEREYQRAKWVGIILGAIIGLGLFVVAPMTANYLDHGSVFIRHGQP